MRNLIIFGLFVIALVMVQFAQAQTADEIIDKYTAARGGKEKLNAVRSIYMEGSRQMMGNEVRVRLTKVQGKLSRTDFEAGGADNFLLITENAAWNYFAMRMQKPEPISGDRVKQLQCELDIAGPLVDYIAKGHQAELIGKEDVEGTACYKIRLTLATGGVISYFIDSKTYLLVRSSHKNGGYGSRHGTGADTDLLTDYSDYKSVEGILFAHTITMKAAGSARAGQAGMGTTFHKVELNKTIADQLYKPE